MYYFFRPEPGRTDDFSSWSLKDRKGNQGKCPEKKRGKSRYQVGREHHSFPTRYRWFRKESLVPFRGFRVLRKKKKRNRVVALFSFKCSCELSVSGRKKYLLFPPFNLSLPAKLGPDFGTFFSISKASERQSGKTRRLLTGIERRTASFRTRERERERIWNGERIFFSRREGENSESFFFFTRQKYKVYKSTEEGKTEQLDFTALKSSKLEKVGLIVFCLIYFAL